MKLPINIKMYLHKWNLNKWNNEEQLIDLIEIIHNKGIVIFSTIGLFTTENLLFLIPLIYGLIFDLKININNKENK